MTLVTLLFHFMGKHCHTDSISSPTPTHKGIFCPIPAPDTGITSRSLFLRRLLKNFLSPVSSLRFVPGFMMGGHASPPVACLDLQPCRLCQHDSQRPGVAAMGRRGHRMTLVTLCLDSPPCFAPVLACQRDASGSSGPLWGGGALTWLRWLHRRFHALPRIWSVLEKKRHKRH